MARQRRPQVPEPSEVTAPEAVEDTAGAAPARGLPAVRAVPEMPREKTGLSGVLESKTVLLYGQAGIGKSTMASEWADGDMFFFDCAGELDDLEVYRGAVSDWTTFRQWCAAYKEEMETTGRFAGCVIDTADMLGTFCSQAVRARLGIVHESDAEWGKGWTMLREEFASHVAKLSALPGGVILVSHSKEVEIKTRSAAYNRLVPTLTGGVRDACINTADLVLFIDYDDGGENRVIYTKPDKFHEAKERGRTPRLSAQIEWPVGRSGWEILKEAWDAGA